MELLPDVGLGSCHLAALIHFHSAEMVGIFQFTLTPRVAPLWEGWGWKVTRVKGRTDWQPEKKHKSLSTKPPTGSKQDGRVAVCQDPLGSHVT